MLLFLLPALCGCGGGREIERCLFVIAMAVDPAPDGFLTVTVKALSGSSDTGSSPASSASSSSGAQEEAEAGYITVSASGETCLRALDLLSATMPRIVDLSQLQEIVLNETLARSGAAFSVLCDIHSLFRANAAAHVVVTPNSAGDFLRNQKAVLGVRLSEYLQVLFTHFSAADVIPPRTTLSAVTAAMSSGMQDAAAIYAAGNTFDAPLALHGDDDLDRLPGHLPRTAPVPNEYLGAALFSGTRMTGTLTGSQTGMLCLMDGMADTRLLFIDGAQYRINTKTRIRKFLDDTGLTVRIRMNLTKIAGTSALSARQIAMRIEQEGVDVFHTLRAAGCDALAIGALAARRTLTIPQWQAQNWPDRYARLPIRVQVDVRLAD